MHKTRKNKQKQKQNKNNTICVEHHYTQANTNNVNKSCSLLQTTGGEDEPTGNRSRKQADGSH